MRPVDEREIREIVREEVRRTLKEGGIELREGRGKKGSKVRTPHGTGTILDTFSSHVKVRLDSGNVIKVHRDRAIVIG